MVSTAHIRFVGRMMSEAEYSWVVNSLSRHRLSLLYDNLCTLHTSVLQIAIQVFR